MKLGLLLLASLFATHALADNFRINEIDCKVEYNLAKYKKNILGKLVKKDSSKLRDSIRVDSFGQGIQVNKDGSPFFTSASYIENDIRLSTHYKTIMDKEENVEVSLNFNSQGEAILPTESFILGPNSLEATKFEKTDTLELEEPVLLRADGRSKTMIESVFYACQAELELKQ